MFARFGLNSYCHVLENNFKVNKGVLDSMNLKTV